GDGINLTGYAQGFDFGPAADNVTFGRYVISTGTDQFVAQKSNTLGGPNAGPLVGTIVICEINYHPAYMAINGVGFNDYQDEFIGLQNISGCSSPFYDPSASTNTWKFREAAEYEFHTGVS